jgi:hypothetical protein
MALFLRNNYEQPTINAWDILGVCCKRVVDILKSSKIVTGSNE